MTKKIGRGPLGKNVLHLRTLKDLTRPEIARAMNMDDDQKIYAIETRNSSRSDIAPQLADYFGIDLEVLLTKDLTGMTLMQIADLSGKSKDRKRLAKQIAEPGPSPEIYAEVVRLFGRAPDFVREEILRILHDAERGGVANNDRVGDNQS